jgi:hypothetical protein
MKVLKLDAGIGVTAGRNARAGDVPEPGRGSMRMPVEIETPDNRKGIPSGPDTVLVNVGIRHVEVSVRLGPDFVIVTVPIMIVDEPQPEEGK